MPCVRAFRLRCTMQALHSAIGTLHGGCEQEFRIPTPRAIDKCFELLPALLHPASAPRMKAHKKTRRILTQFRRIGYGKLCRL